jgi:anti-sigma regulatory factor (Ser/Thr protein kinase)
VTAVISNELRIQILASKAAVGVVRDMVARRLRTWALPGMIDDVVLATGEMAANAVAVTPFGGHIWARLSLDQAGVLLEIWDPSEELPARTPQMELTLETLDLSPENFDDNGGRGLAILDTLADGWNVRPHPTGGKIVWSRFTTG